MQNDDYVWPCGAGYPARGPSFQRVQPPGKAAAGKIACPTFRSRPLIACGGLLTRPAVQRVPDLRSRVSRLRPRSLPVGRCRPESSRGGSSGVRDSLTVVSGSAASPAAWRMVAPSGTGVDRPKGEKMTW